MRWLMKRLETYLDRKGLVLNAEKTKVMRFEGGGGRRKRVKQWWKGKEIEEVKEMNYLGYRFRKGGTGSMWKGEKGDGGDGTDVGDREKEVWGDWEKRMKIFVWLVGSVVAFGAEIWGWKDWDKIERIQERYMR